MISSGIRIGSPALTTRGMKEPEMELIGDWISKILLKPNNKVMQQKIKGQIQELTQQFPLYKSRAS